MIRPSPEIDTREQFARLCNLRGLKNFAVEIGVERAGFAVRFLQKWAGHKLWCIDPWRDDLEGYHEPDLTRFDREPDFLMTCAALARFDRRVTIKRTTSEAAAPRYPDGLFDFIYHDANHAYPFISRDLAAWWDKLQPAGIYAGHDFDEANHPGVARAVREFAAEKGLDVLLTHEPHYRSWYIYKTPPLRLFESAEETLRQIAFLERQASRDDETIDTDPGA